jgi:hypothetical protein
MIVILKGQGPGAAHAVPRTGSGPPASPRAGPHLEPPAVPGTTSEALFDANGDGAIENWGFLHGGDSYTTFTPPPTGADPTRANRSTDGADAKPARPVPGTAHAPGRKDTPAAMQHAHTAYRRDGLAQPAVTRPPVTQPAPTPALRSAG